MLKGMLPAIAVLGLAITPALGLTSDRPAPPEGAKVYFISPSDGETIEGSVTVRMGLRGMGVAPAGVEVDNTGHHHLLVNATIDDIDLDASLPFSDETRHFGGGQTEASLDLPAGTHTLQLLFMDYRHISFDPPVASDVITITVE
ncbi:hypothetical protein THITH_07580 [Thioalkalivibrio paradoxus ARh 1]|uniref:DUF4399 domain-containing protein n=2 Tax=Thioalkalivibrio paradoxus TaxID=108010 RepID=W0DMD2_9GAMM|nr:hypothetical protein THITH_07580 [Thioalkalivibrio paradoxus ARh 1]